MSVNVYILGKGFVGTHLYKLLKEENTFFVNFVSRKEVNYFDEISLKKYVRESFHNGTSDIVFVNCSGYTGKPNVDACESNKEICLEYNTQIPIFMMNFCDKYNY